MTLYLEPKGTHASDPFVAQDTPHSTIVELKRLLTQFIIKGNPLAFRGKFGVCEFCGCAREYPDPNDPNVWKPKHYDSCLFARAERAVSNDPQP